MGIVGKYIKYRFRAKKRHGVHSPFVYDIMDNVALSSIPIEDDNKIERLVSGLKNNTETIDFQENGAGSKKLKDIRKVSSVLRNSSSKGKYGEFLYKLNKHFKFENILEFGTSLGLGTIYFSLGNPLSTITTIEGCSNTRNVALRNFNELKLKNIHSIRSTFNDFLSKKNPVKYDCIFIDGHHDGKALLQYLESLKGNYHNDSLIILDDIRWSDSMYESWLKITHSDEFNLSMDFFRFGIVSPRKQQEKEHFTLRL